MDTALRPPDLHRAYRPDIDGLRAIAVLSVVGYHAFPAHVTGGFVGVDIFFVISGFLISSIITDAARHDRFSTLDFYARRIKRIFPALLLVLFATWVFGWFELFSNEFRTLGKHLVGGATFVSNFVLRSESGYFDSASETKPLLHLWSLAIEEQFYIFWPLLLTLLVRKTRATTTFLVIAAIALASFSLNLALVADEPTTAFYSPFTRLWELLLGGLLAHVAARRAMPPAWRPFASVCGLALIAWAVLQFSPSTPYPSWYALAPVIGTTFVIAAGPRALPNRVLLGSRPALWFGSISYPLYLWHWPILSIAYIENGAQTPGAVMGLLVLLAVLLAWATDRLLERRIRGSADLRLRPAILCCVMIALGALGWATVADEGFPSRMPAQNAYVESFDSSLPDLRYAKAHDLAGMMRNECNYYDVERWLQGRETKAPRASLDPSCTTRPAGADKVVFLWGDSHAQHLNYGLRRLLPSDVGLLQIATSGCDPNVPGTASPAGAYCDTSNQAAMDTVRRTRPEVVIVAQRDGHTAARLRTIATALLAAGAGRVIVIGPMPQWRLELHKVIARHYWNATPDHLERFLDLRVERQAHELKASLTDREPFVFIDLFDALCNEHGCTTYIDGDRDDGLITYDYGHLTPRSSIWLARHVLMPVVAKTLASVPSSREVSTPSPASFVERPR